MVGLHQLVDLTGTSDTKLTRISNDLSYILLDTVHTVRLYYTCAIILLMLTSFIVVFCNTLQRPDCNDLEILSDFVTSLESSQTLSKGAEKLYKICDLFLKVVKICVSARDNHAKSQLQSFNKVDYNSIHTTSEVASMNLSTIAQFNPYLSALGLVPNFSKSTIGVTSEVIPLDAEYNLTTQTSSGMLRSEDLAMDFAYSGEIQNSTQDWFSSSRQLMNLVELSNDY